MEMTSTIFAAAGAVIAALIASYWSFAKLITSKEQKISEFRQAWIDALRNDIAEYIGNLSKLEGICLAQSSDKSITDIFQHHAETIASIDNLAYRIRFRLNPIEDQNIFTLIDDIDRILANPDRLRDGDSLGNTAHKLATQTQKLLKTEWERVKKGEPGFRYTRNFSIALGLAAIAVMALYWPS